LQNRDAMRKGSWSGLYGLGPEDAAVNLSQGPVLDRTKEHLVPADVACTRVRRLLLDAVQRVSEGGDPPGLRPSQSDTIAAIEFTMPDDEMWTERVPGNIEVAESNASLQRA
jgi:hypothetical protein